MKNNKKVSTFSRIALLSGVLALCIPFFAQAATLNRQLEVGMTGTDVSALQSFLAKDITIYPQGLVTGYFGFLTKSAVSNFQSKNGLDPVGRVGPATLPVINLQMDGSTSASVGTAPMISAVNINIGNTSATVSWNTNEYAKGVVYYSTSPLTTYERTNSVDVSGNTAMTDDTYKVSQNVTLSNLQSNTTYYYLVYTTDQSGNVSVTWPNVFHTSY